jgi:hypothetical protein
LCGAEPGAAHPIDSVSNLVLGATHPAPRRCPLSPHGAIPALPPRLSSSPFGLPRSQPHEEHELAATRQKTTNAASSSQQHLLTVHTCCCKSSKIPPKPLLAASAALASPSRPNDISSWSQFYHPPAAMASLPPLPSRRRAISDCPPLHIPLTSFFSRLSRKHVENVDDVGVFAFSPPPAHSRLPPRNLKVP